MINFKLLREKYKKIIFWGALHNSLRRYKDYICVADYIVDIDNNKWGTTESSLLICDPTSINKEDSHSIAIIILPLAAEKEIYTQIRRLGFHGDIYTDDMIELSENHESDYFNEIGCYTIEKHTQILMALLKKYNVKNVVVSPGVCNMNFVYSVQNDSYFKLWSCLDERSAAYMACGIAQTLGEPVAISCTGATASRNYMSALTEAYYSHLPIVAVTSSRSSYMIGNGIEQVTDRLHHPADIFKDSVELSEINDINDKKYCEHLVNRVLSALTLNEGGPVHINLITKFSKDFSVKTLPKCRSIKTLTIADKTYFPKIKGSVGIYLKPGLKLNDRVTGLLEKFCERYNAVVVIDHLSNYTGKYAVLEKLVAKVIKKFTFETLIYSGAVNSNNDIPCRSSWRVSTDGRIEDEFLNQEYYFNMSLQSFLESYVDCDNSVVKNITLAEKLIMMYDKYIESIPELPFSNMWIASKTAGMIPANSICYFGIYSTLRNWSYFSIDKTVKCYSTVGGYGIDGTLSAMMGASFVNIDKLCFCFMGDLSFFYDMNSLGNRHIVNNVRIMVFNNNGGNSLQYGNGLPQTDGCNDYCTAVNHFEYDGKDGSTIKAYAEALGYRYLVATNKDEYLFYISEFLTKSSKPIIFEIQYLSESDFKAIDIVFERSIIL